MYSINSPKNVDEYESQNRCEPCCQTFTDNKPCTETETLGILREFQNLYEDKLKQIDDQPAKNKAQMKIRLLREWVRDLEEQNTMLVQVVEELEQEASERVILLEEKLHLSSKAAYQAMASIEVQPPVDTETDQLKDRITYLESDVKGLMEVIKRIRHQNNWNTDGILFYTISCNDIFGSEHIELPCSSPCKEVEIVKDELKITQNKLCVKSEEYQILCDKYNKLEKSSKDMRDALTAEVADKHDNIRALRYEYQLLEEQCRQLDKQAQFKDDIIKEMRKELRGVRSKQQLSKLEEIQKVHEMSQQHVNEAWEKCKNTKYNQNLSMKDLNEYNLIVEQEHNILYELKKEIDHLVKDMHQKEQQVLEQNEIIDFLNKKIIEAQGILTDIHLKSKKYKKDAENAAYNHEICEQKILKLQESLNNIGLEKNIQNENLLVMQNYHENSTQEQILLGNVKKQINIMIDNLKNRESNIHVLENLMETLEITLINIQDELTSITQKVEKYFVENNDIKTENQQYRFEELHSQLRIHDHKKDIWNKCCSGDDHLQNDQQYECREINEKECGDALKEPGKQDQQIQDLQIMIAHLQNELIKSQQEVIEVRNSFMGDRQLLANENNQMEIDFERTDKEIENASTIVKHRQQTHIEINSEKDQQILKLAKIVKQYANEIDLYKEQIENLQSGQLALMNLNVPTQKIVNDFEEYRIKLSESQATIECLKNELNIYRKSISIREDKLFFMENKLKTVNNWFQKLQNKLLKLNTEIEPIDTKQLFSLLLSNAQNGLEKISKEVALYQQEVLKVDKEVKKNESKVEIEQKKLNEEQNVMLQILKEINVKDVESATYQFKVQSLQKALHLAQMKNMELKMESKQGINNYDQEIMFQLQEYKKEISDLNEKNNILENTVVQMELTIKDMQKKMSDCINEKNCSETSLQENIISLKQLKLKLENVDEESKQLIETNLFLKKENQLLHDKIKELQNSLQKMTDETEKNINVSFDNSYNKLCANKFPNEQEFKKCKMRLNELENSVISKDAIIENLQQAVNLHQNTILELEKQTLETCKAKELQKQTINSLQEALVSVKNQLSDLQGNTSHDVSSTWGWPVNSGLRSRSNNNRTIHDV